jgi:hypothetical protein
MLVGRPEYFERTVAQADPSAVEPSMAAPAFAAELVPEAGALVLEVAELELHAARARLAASATSEIPVHFFLLQEFDQRILAQRCRQLVHFGWIPRSNAQATTALARDVPRQHVPPARGWSPCRE